MEKKAQFFIIGAVIIGLVILSIASTWNFAKSKPSVSQEKFQATCDSYRHEVFEVSKYATQGNKSGEPDLIQDFTLKFMEYTEKSEPGFKLVYVYGNKEKVFVGNYLGETIKANNITVPDHQAISLENMGTIVITDKINKEYDLDSYDRFYFIAIEDKGGERYVCE